MKTIVLSLILAFAVPCFAGVARGAASDAKVAGAAKASGRVSFHVVCAIAKAASKL